MPMMAIAEAVDRHHSTIHRGIRLNFCHDLFPDRWNQEYQGHFCTYTQRYVRNRRSPCQMKPTLKPHPVAVEFNADDVLEGGHRPGSVAKFAGGRRLGKPRPLSTVEVTR